MQALTAWLIQRPIAYGLVMAASVFVGYVGVQALMGKLHGLTDALIYAVVLGGAFAIRVHLHNKKKARRP